MNTPVSFEVAHQLVMIAFKLHSPEGETLLGENARAFFRHREDILAMNGWTVEDYKAECEARFDPEE